MSARTVRNLGVGLIYVALGVGLAAPAPVPNGAALFVGLLAIAGVLLVNHSGAMK